MGSLYGRGSWNIGVYSRGNVWALTGQFGAFKVTFDGTPSTPIALVGNMIASINISTTRINVFLGLFATIDLDVEIKQSRVHSLMDLQGNIGFQPLVNGAPYIGPFWDPVDDCTCVQWTANDSCTMENA